MASISFLKGFNQGQTVKLAGSQIILGRDAEGCQLHLNVPAVSRKHAVIELIEGKYYIQDLKSRNGTFVNNQEIKGRTLLQDNDRIKICDNLMAFVESPPPLQPLPEAINRSWKEEKNEEDDSSSSSTVEATLSQSSKQVLQAQPADKLTILIDITNELTQNLNLKELLPRSSKVCFRSFAKLIAVSSS